MKVFLRLMNFQRFNSDNCIYQIQNLEKTRLLVCNALLFWPSYLLFYPIDIQGQIFMWANRILNFYLPKEIQRSKIYWKSDGDNFLGFTSNSVCKLRDKWRNRYGSILRKYFSSFDSGYKEKEPWKVGTILLRLQSLHCCNCYDFMWLERN